MCGKNPCKYFFAIHFAPDSIINCSLSSTESERKDIQEWDNNRRNIMSVLTAAFFSASVSVDDMLVQALNLKK